MSNYILLVEPFGPSKGDGETYNVLVFFRIMGYLRDCDRAADLLIVLGGAWCH
jgi:hypothetical protein